MKRRTFLSLSKSLGVIFLCLLITLNAHANGPLKNTLEVFLVSEEKTNNGVQEKLLRIDEAKPGDTLEYVLTYENTGNSRLSGFSIKNPIPNNTHYVSDSANSSVNADFKVSIDKGSTFGSEPLFESVRDAQGNERQIVVPVEKYNLLKWHISKELEPNQTMEVRYRVIIK